MTARLGLEAYGPVDFGGAPPELVAFLGHFVATGPDVAGERRRA